jgi:signal transduction histidine kinase
LLDDLLDLSRIEAGKLTLEAAPFGPREVMGRVLENMALWAREKGLTLTCEVAEDVSDRLLGNALRLRQVLLTFVGNAIKFASRGNVVVRSAVQSRTEEAVWLEFSVSDTGRHWRRIAARRRLCSSMTVMRPGQSVPESYAEA